MGPGKNEKRFHVGPKEEFIYFIQHEEEKGGQNEKNTSTKDSANILYLQAPREDSHDCL